MTPEEFVKKWNRMFLSEMAAAQSHFLDVCDLVGHPHPTEMDPEGTHFTFEASTTKPSGRRGRADAYYKGHFIWEYKGPHKDLDKAYQQLLLYREALGNPPLLITSDMRDIIIHTNFTNTVSQTFTVDFESILSGEGVDVLRRAFHNPSSFYDPSLTQEVLTQATANTFVAVADALQKYTYPAGQEPDPERLAHFIIRLLFALFAEDMRLLPERLFTQLVEYEGSSDAAHLASSFKNLFAAMREGGLFGFHRIRNFDGALFDDEYVPPNIPSDLTRELLRACQQDWANIDPSIFGTLFERIIDASKRAQLGAHYTSKEDILLIVEPVLMQPLIQAWEEVRTRANVALRRGEAEAAASALRAFSEKIAATRVLDPACGSGNFLYVALRRLLDLQKAVIAFAARNGLPDIPLTVGPEQLYGIEINPYAHELAQVTIWIGYLQWRGDNGFPEVIEPVLRPLHQIERKDAILAFDDAGRPVDPTWPEADVIVGNPPFLGSKKIRAELGDEYVDNLFALYEDRVPHEADLVCYWFEKARAMIAEDKIQRAGLLATQAIRGGANRVVLERIKETGDIFWAQSDRDWILDGATVHVSMIGFDDGTQKDCELDETSVKHINADLTSSVDLTVADSLLENQGLSFMGVTPAGPFYITGELARKWIARTDNPENRPNSDVVRPYYNGLDLNRRERDVWIVDFGIDMPLEEASLYKLPFEYVRREVYPVRSKNKRASYREKWWLLAETRSGMREALADLDRYIATSMVSKHQFFDWVSKKVLPANLLIVIARDDDYFLGVLHAKPHELWARRTGTQLREAESGFRYTPTTTFETYPFPWPPGHEPAEDADPRVAAIAQAARELVAFRDGWQHPPEEEVGVTISCHQLKKRTLTNLYNALTFYREEIKGHPAAAERYHEEYGRLINFDDISYLDYIHTTLDHAVLDAYGWPHHLSDRDILQRLLDLNRQRAAASKE